jgi:hypothetical protein
MSTADNMHRRLSGKVFEAPGGSEWKALLDLHPQLDIYLAGGCVRDELMGRRTEPKDFDFFIGGSGLDESLRRLAETGQLTRNPFGSPRWYPRPDYLFYYDVIPIGRFFNGLWNCGDITDVLNQFDFTANAVAVNLRTGVFFDPQNGKRDISRRVMRAVRFDYPNEPISSQMSLTRPEIVWFRILHYAAALNLTIEPITLAWLKANENYADSAGRFAELFFPLDPAWAKSLEKSPQGS